MATTEYIQVAGKSDIYVGFSDDNYASLKKLGEQENDTVLTERPYLNDVHGDRHGGTSGPPIEVQLLGKIVSGQMRLSRFDLETYEKIKRMCGAQATAGKLTDAEIGTLLLRDFAMRLVIVPSKGTQITTGVPTGPGDNYFFYNFPCCLIRSPVVCNQGSKHSILNFEFEAHRVPEGHYFAGSPKNKLGVLWDRDDDVVPT